MFVLMQLLRNLYIILFLQVRPLVNSVLDGFNGCVFAYGQTGTGKTFTMEGGLNQEGIIPRTFSHIWHHIQSEASEDVTYLVSCSYIELYMEIVRDLLKKDGHKNPLTLRGQVIYCNIILIPIRYFVDKYQQLDTYRQNTPDNYKNYKEPVLIILLFRNIRDSTSPKCHQSYVDLQTICTK